MDHLNFDLVPETNKAKSDRLYEENYKLRKELTAYKNFVTFFEYDKQYADYYKTFGKFGF